MPLVSDEQQMSIGAFARACGISIPRLRRYHDGGLLIAANVDPATGYRSYGSDQITRAVAIRRLRDADLPIDRLAAALDGTQTARLAALHAQRALLEARVRATQEQLRLLDTIIEEEHRTMPTTPAIALMEVILQTDDVESLVSFYRDVFGIDFQADDHNGAAPTHYDACGGTWDPAGFFLFTIFPAAAGHTSRSRFGFGVPDLDAAFERALRQGAEPVAEPADLGYAPRGAVVTDPAGNTVNLYERNGDW